MIWLMHSEERASAISGRLEDVLGEPLTSPPRRLSGGASRETWAVSTVGHGELIAQLEPRAGSYADRPSQAPLLEVAAAAGVPVPRVIAHGTDEPVLGRSWMIVESLAGTTDPKLIIEGDGVPAGPELIESIAAALAAVHRMPADPGLVPVVDDPLALVRQMHDSLGEPHPTFELAFRELEASRPAGRPSTFVHGDFRVGNLMVGDRGVTGVLDWELAHIGDPVADLGWVCVPAWRFGKPGNAAGGLGTREQLLAAYARHSGLQVDLAELRWWELWGTLRWGVICGMQAFSHLSGGRSSIEHAVIGRRACEVEWDLLEALGHDSTDATSAFPCEAERGVTLHDRPTVRELLDAARGALGDDVLPKLRGRAAFQLRVTLRALGIVERELAFQREHEQLHAATLAGLGVAHDAALAASIRGGRFAGREPELRAALRAIVRAKLEVANPRYLEES
jgi:aminoglycoside phosphotransferase (APT) family kinase protein